MDGVQFIHLVVAQKKGAETIFLAIDSSSQHDLIDMRQFSEQIELELGNGYQYLPHNPSLTCCSANSVVCFK